MRRRIVAKLVETKAGRILLHLACLTRDGRLTAHLAGISREFFRI